MKITNPIRKATEQDIDLCDKIARHYRHELGFVSKVKMRDAIQRDDMLVYDNGSVIGFVLYRTRRDGWHTIYDIAVHPEYTRSGIGRSLIAMIPEPIRLKCVYGITANDFYEATGFECVSYETGRKRPLNVWQKIPKQEFCETCAEEVE